MLPHTNLRLRMPRRQIGEMQVKRVTQLVLESAGQTGYRILRQRQTFRMVNSPGGTYYPDKRPDRFYAAAGADAD